MELRFADNKPGTMTAVVNGEKIVTPLLRAGATKGRGGPGWAGFHALGWGSAQDRRQLLGKYGGGDDPRSSSPRSRAPSPARHSPSPRSHSIPCNRPPSSGASGLDFRIDVGGSCTTGAPPVAGTTDLVLPTLTWSTALTGLACTGGKLTADPAVLTNRRRVSGLAHTPCSRAPSSPPAPAAQSAMSSPASVVVVPDASLPGMGGPVDVALADAAGQRCVTRTYSRDDAESAPVPRPPTAKRVAYGYASFGASGLHDGVADRVLLLREPGAFPDGAELWLYEANLAHPSWRLALPVHDFPGQVESWVLGDARGIRARRRSPIPTATATSPT